VGDFDTVLLVELANMHSGSGTIHLWHAVVQENKRVAPWRAGVLLKLFKAISDQVNRCLTVVHVVALSLHRRNQFNLASQEFNVEDLVIHNEHPSILNIKLGHGAKDFVQASAHSHN
jgi:hypothetical protein